MRDAVVLITGGTGTFGKAMARACLELGAKQIRIFSRDELKQSEMAREFDDKRIEYLCGDVRDYERVLTATEGVDIVIHAAAMKRIEKCERDPLEAIKTNVNGSANVAKACLANNVKHAIAISTDKAAYPINTYGKSKALMESLWIQSNVYRGKNHPTMFSVVRYGNVIGSRGSVIPLFMKQAEDGAVKVRHPQMTRFFLTIEEAVILVDIAVRHQKGGEIFLPGLRAMNIESLAKAIAPGARVEYTGITAGEKLHEDLLTEDEAARAHVYSNAVIIIDPAFPSWPYTRAEGGKSLGVIGSSSDAEKYTDHEIRQLIHRVA